MKMSRYIEEIIRRDGRLSCVNEEILKRTIRHFYTPIYEWINSYMNAQQETMLSSGHVNKCVCIGYSSVQGSGKTTTVRYLKEAFTAIGKKCAVVSLDDFYWPRTKQIQVAREFPSNPLLEYRGNPGTHDINLLIDFIQKCKGAGASDTINIPKYNKSSYNGRGDRAPFEEWPVMEGPIDLLLIEGWCMGFQALPNSELLNEQLKPINNALCDFEKLYKELHALIIIKVKSQNWVYKWRNEQEQHLRDQNLPALSEQDVMDFVDRFMPAYHAYLPQLYAQPAKVTKASVVDSLPRLLLEIDEFRMPITADMR